MKAYNVDEQRVVEWLRKRTGDQVGGGDDPIGFLLASYDCRNRELREAREQKDRLTTALQLIEGIRYRDRQTVTEANAWEAFRTLNQQMTMIFDIVKVALNPPVRMAQK